MDTTPKLFRVRGYELDADGLVPPHIWLRYMEHLRWLAIGDEPELIERHLRGGIGFMVVAQALTLHRDASVGTELEGTLWVGRVGRTSVDFCHAFSAAATGEPIARGVATAVHFEDRRPAPVPGELRQAVTAPAASLDLPAALEGDPPAEAHEYMVRVRPADLDFLGHSNHSNYCVFADAARHAAATAGALGEASEPARARIRGLNIQYSAETLCDQELTALTWQAATSPLTVGCELRRQETLLSRVRMILAHGGGSR
jgi:acyl-CoA thioesterase FadM